MTCAACGQPATEGQRFCRNCGKPLTASPAPQTPPSPGVGEPPRLVKPTPAGQWGTAGTASAATPPSGDVIPTAPVQPGQSGSPITAGPTPTGPIPTGPIPTGPFTTGPFTTGPVPTGPFQSAAASTPGGASAGWDASDPLLGAATPNDTYLGNRLSYSDVPTPFDPLSNPSYLAQLKVRFGALFSTWALGQVLLFIFLAGPALMMMVNSMASSFSPYGGSEPSGGGLFAFYSVVSWIWTIALIVLFLVVKLPVQLSEWMLTVDGKGDAAQPALEHMVSIIEARRPPLTGMSVVRLAVSGQYPRDYLQLEDGNYLGFVSSFAYGSDLYIGWTFWLNVSPGRWLITMLARLFKGWGSGVYGSLVFDVAKALREVMHSAVRQGVDVAVGTTEASGLGIIGTRIQVTPVNLPRPR